MRSRRRRNNQHAFSLFSFQDIMMAVMGILILITLLLALDLTDAADDYAESSADVSSVAATVDGESDVDRHQFTDLLKEYALLKQQHEALVQQAQDIAEVAKAGEDGRSRLINELNDLYAQIAALNDQVNARKKQLGEQSELNQSIRERVHEIHALRKYEQQLVTEIASRERNPQVTYIIAPDTERRAILVELSDKLFRIGPALGANSSVTMKARGMEALVGQFKQAMKLYRPSSDYFVVLIKPSAFGELHLRIEQAAKAAGFATGRDLITENSAVFPDSLP